MPYLTSCFSFFQPQTDHKNTPCDDFIMTLTNVLIELLPSLTHAQQQTLLTKAIDYLQPLNYPAQIQELQAELKAEHLENLIPNIDRSLFRTHIEDIKQWISNHILDSDSKDYLNALDKLADHRRYSNSTPFLFGYKDSDEPIDTTQVATKKF